MLSELRSDSAGATHSSWLKVPKPAKITPTSPLELTASAVGRLRRHALGRLDLIRGREHPEDDAVLARGPLVEELVALGAVALAAQPEGAGNVVLGVAGVISTAAASDDQDEDKSHADERLPHENPYNPAYGDRALTARLP